MQTSIQAPWSPIACKPDTDGTQRQIRGYIYFDKDRRCYDAMIVPERVEVLVPSIDGKPAIVTRTSKSHECRVIRIEGSVTRHNGKKHAEYARNFDKQEALQHGARYGYEPFTHGVHCRCAGTGCASLDKE